MLKLTPLVLVLGLFGVIAAPPLLILSTAALFGWILKREQEQAEKK